MQKEALWPGGDIAVIMVGEAKQMRIGRSDPKARRVNEGIHEAMCSSATGETLEQTVLRAKGTFFSEVVMREPRPLSGVP